MKKMIMISVLLVACATLGGAQSTTQTVRVGYTRLFATVNSSVYQQAFNAAGGGFSGDISGYWAVQFDASEQASELVETLAWCLDNPQAPQWQAVCGGGSLPIFSRHGITIVPKQ